MFFHTHTQLKFSYPLIGVDVELPRRVARPSKGHAGKAAGSHHQPSHSSFIEVFLRLAMPLLDAKHDEQGVVNYRLPVLGSATGRFNILHPGYVWGNEFYTWLPRGEEMPPYTPSPS